MTIPIRSGPYRTFHRLKPHESYLEFEGSTITIPLRGRMTEGSPWMEDEISLKAFMRLEVFPAYVNGLGTREFQFIIRDWELHGSSELLNKLFFGHPLGRECPGGELEKLGRCHGERLPATLTFSVSNNYDKDGDDKDECLGPCRALEIRNLTSHDLRMPDDGGDGHLLYGVPGNSIYWQMKVKGNSASVVFFKRPPGNAEKTPTIDAAKDHECVLGMVANVPLKSDGPSHFRATLDTAKFRQSSNVIQALGNSRISPLGKARTPLEIRWCLGEKPRDGAGRIRIVSPARSLGTAMQGPEVGRPFDSADFPCRIAYAINYHIHVNDQRFVEDQAGIAIAEGAMEIPPRDVTVAFDKPHFGRVLGRFLEFDRGHCTGMHEIPEEAFQQGANLCRYWRTVPLAANAPWPAPYDPSVQY